MIEWNKKEAPLKALAGMGGGVGRGGGVSEDGTQSKPFTSIANAYSVGATNGLHYFQNSGVNSGNAFQLRYASYDGRGWVETFYSLDTAQTTPWDHFLNYVNNADRPTLINFNLSNGGLDYTSISGSVITLGTGFNIVDVAITSKSSKTGNGVAATGQNQQSALPLIASNDLAGTQASQCREALANFFEGSGTGFSVGAGPGGYPEDFAAYWSKSGSNPTGPFEIHLGYREGNKTTNEFHLADGYTSSGGTYAPNIGWRVASQSYGGAYVGSWSSSTSGKSGYAIGSGNVLSVWLSDAT